MSFLSVSVLCPRAGVRVDNISSQERCSRADSGQITWLGHSMTGLTMAGGSRPARSQPAAVAASGRPTTARAR